MSGGGGFLRSGFGSGGLLRRRSLFSTGLAFGGLAAAASIGGCSTVRASPAAKPTSSPPATVLLASIPFQGNGNYQGTMQQLMEEFIAQNFSAKHPGVVVKTQAGSGANGSNTGSQALTVAALAGQKTPDTLCGCWVHPKIVALGGLLLIPFPSIEVDMGGASEVGACGPEVGP